MVFIIKHEIEADFKAKIGSRIEKYMEVRYAIRICTIRPQAMRPPRPREALGHRSAITVDVIDAPFAVINSDDYYGVECFELLYRYLSQPREAGDYCMVGYLLKNTVTDNGSVARGVCASDENGNLAVINERTRIEKFPGGIHYTEDDGATWVDLPEDTLVSMNMWGFQPEFVGALLERFPAWTTPSNQPHEGRVPAPQRGARSAGCGQGHCQGALQPRQVVWRHLSRGQR